MFGSFRFMLAFFVVLTHLISISKLGQFAVFGFFVLILVNRYSHI